MTIVSGISLMIILLSITGPLLSCYTLETSVRDAAYSYFMIYGGIVGCWLGIGTDETTRGIVMLFRWKSKRWQKKSLV